MLRMTGLSQPPPRRGTKGVGLFLVILPMIGFSTDQIQFKEPRPIFN